MGIIICMRTRKRWRGNRKPKGITAFEAGYPWEVAMPGRRGGEVGKAAYVGTGFVQIGEIADSVVHRLRTR